MPPAGLEPPIPESERPQTHALDRAATGIDWQHILLNNLQCSVSLDLFFFSICVMYVNTKCKKSHMYCFTDQCNLYKWDFLSN
jgi:hypothetical protein